VKGRGTPGALPRLRARGERGDIALPALPLAVLCIVRIELRTPAPTIYAFG
jgi:hypothetical protein